MSAEQNVRSVVELPQSGHLAFEFDESVYALDYRMGTGWFVSLGALQIARVREGRPGWRTSGAHDPQASSRHDSLALALIAATARY